MSPNNKYINISLLLIGTLILIIYLNRQLEKKIDLIWQDITVVGDTLKAELDEIKDKIDLLES